MINNDDAECLKSTNVQKFSYYFGFIFTLRDKHRIFSAFQVLQKEKQSPQAT